MNLFANEQQYHETYKQFKRKIPKKKGDLIQKSIETLSFLYFLLEKLVAFAKKTEIKQILETIDTISLELKDRAGLISANYIPSNDDPFENYMEKLLNGKL